MTGEARETDEAGRLGAALDAIPGSLAVAVSGGIDSLTLAAAAHARGPGRVTMFHAVSPAVPGDATARVERIASRFGWALRVVDAGEFEDADYRANPVNRCYFCKTNLYGSIGRHTDAQMLSGANLDDLGEYRPGLDAAAENRVRHPFLEARIGKAAVRRLAREVGLGDLAELPAAPCLSSRIETGIAIRADVLKAVHAVERRLAADFPEGIIRCRVRASGIVVELDPATLEAVRGGRERVLRDEIGAAFTGKVATAEVSLAPYRNGSAFLRSVPA